LGANLEEEQLLQKLSDLHAKVTKDLRMFRRKPLLAVFRLLPFWALLTFGALGYVAVRFLLPRYGIAATPANEVNIGFAVALVLAGLGYLVVNSSGRHLAKRIAIDLAQARHWHELCLQKGEARFRRDQERIQSDWDKANHDLDEQWHVAVTEAEHERAERPGQIDAKKTRALHKAGEIHHELLERLEGEHAAVTTARREATKSQEEDVAGLRDGKMAELERETAAERAKLLASWQAVLMPISDQLQALNRFAAQLFPDWRQGSWQNWSPPERLEPAVSFATTEVDLEKFSEVNLRNRGLISEQAARFAAPLLLRYPDQASLLLETTGEGATEAIGTMNSLIFRLLSVSPPGKVNFTIIDPVGLGQNFAGLMHLADFEDNPINGRIWTQPAQIEERLGELNEHMEKVIQMYLRNEYATIAEYNAHAGAAAEKYHVVIIAGFPVNFSETAARRLLNIAASGARCGVHLVIHWDRRHAPPFDFVADDLRKSCIRLIWEGGGFRFPDPALGELKIKLDTPPPPQFVTDFLRKAGESAKDSNRVELPFSQVAPGETERWSLNATEEIRVPIGRAGAARLQNLLIGRGTRQHGLVAGKTGSGKSNLFHVIITNLSLWYSPEEIEFYLVDFKKGVEFKCYANSRLPHARVVAIESDREFGLSVLQRLDEELRRRGDLFRKMDVQDFAGYRRSRASEALPRVLLVIDEFQEFFTEEDRISQGAALLLDRIVRQGRAFGIHVLLGSQTLGGAYTLARATIGQMVIRIALQCNEADAYLIMDENNAAPRLLSRPGEGIYNDMAGAPEGNSPFQTVWFPDEVRDQRLPEIRTLFEREARKPMEPIVFEGNAPTQIERNDLLSRSLASTPVQAPPTSRIWLGAPNSIKGPTEVKFERQSGSNFLVAGQADEAALAITAAGLISLAAQYPPAALRLILLESTPPESPERQFLDRVIRSISHTVGRPKRPEIADVLNGLASEIKARAGGEASAGEPEVFLLILGLQEFKALRSEDEFSFSSDAGVGPTAAASFSSILADGPVAGIHVLASIDTYNNVSRFLGRKGLSEFQLRVLFQMSPSDSASLIDSPEASKLGLHRALLYNEREGSLEKFRPYALPSNAWLEEVEKRIAKRVQPG
jgi:hypothetical protein